ncbi:MAG: lipid-A-disaccharide synthase [bacterium]|nr:lipid-A-disaccharide synthase [bacterium]
MNPPTRFLIVAGEVSGDIHAANLLLELRRMRPEISAFGVGGERLKDAGLSLIHHTDELAHMGLVEVIRELPRIRSVLQHVVKVAEEEHPQLAILVDSPDFNLRLAKRLQALGIPVILYVSPQLWAWRRGRVRTVRRLAREVLCILPFEVEFYEQSSVRARYVGHPLVDDIADCGLLGGSGIKNVGQISLLPGSRAMEVRSLLPTMLATLKILPTEAVNRAILVEAPGVGGEIDRVLEHHGYDDRLSRVRGPERRQELSQSQLAWTASGTATLECALLDVPMIVGYRLQALSYAIARLLVRVPHVALVNLIARERLAPELLQRRWEPHALCDETLELLKPEVANIQLSGLKTVRTKLGAQGASTHAAEAILEVLESNSR